jgi:hypothetical protein
MIELMVFMETIYYEVMFSKTTGSRSVFWRLYIQLNPDDVAILEKKITPALKTRLFVHRVAALDLLPSGLNDGWHYSGRVMDHDIIGSWDGGVDPIIRDGGRKIWIVPEAG